MEAGIKSGACPPFFFNHRYAPEYSKITLRRDYRIHMSEYICPHCGNPIYDDEALLCLYCGENLKRSIGVMGSIKYPTPRIVIAVIVGVLLLCFALFLAR